MLHGLAAHLAPDQPPRQSFRTIQEQTIGLAPSNLRPRWRCHSFIHIKQQACQLTVFKHSN